MARRLLIDNDALLKLARYGLLDTAITAFGASPSDVRVLATAKYSLLPTKNRLLRCKDEASAARLEDFLSKTVSLSTADTDAELLDTLNAVPSIDAGEALLLAAGASDGEAVIITGDKRALAALCSDDSVSHVAHALAGRVASLEVLFWQMVEQHFHDTQLCVRSNPDIDKALSNAFGMSAPASLDSAREALASYIRHLRGITNTLLFTPFN